MYQWYETQISCACGGQVQIKDWGEGGAAPEFRFEASCDRCLDCDPNGYATLKEALANAQTFFDQNEPASVDDVEVPDAN